MTNPNQPRTLPRLMRYWVTRLLAILLGIGAAVVIFEGMLHLFPGLIPDGRARAVDLGVVQFTVGMGDIFVNRPGIVAPPEHPNDVLSEHRLTWDADGFRVPAHPASQYDVVALGDSYTEAANVALPWPDVMAEHSKLAVRNMGFRGYGPVEESRILHDYAVKTGARLVIVGFFEGNDLDDEVSARWRGEFILPNIARKAIAPFDPKAEAWKTDKTGPFQFPINVEINGVRHPLAFLDSYLTILNAERADYAQSDNIVSLEKTLQDMTQTANTAQTCLIFAYFPDKEHIYLPYVVPEDRAQLLSTIRDYHIERPGTLLVDAPLKSSYEQIMARLEYQHDAIAATLAKYHIPLVDLLPAFKAAAARGEMLYYEYDTHWSQAGHNLAGQTIATYLTQHPTPCTEATSH